MISLDVNGSVLDAICGARVVALKNVDNVVFVRNSFGSSIIQRVVSHRLYCLQMIILCPHLLVCMFADH